MLNKNEVKQNLQQMGIPITQCKACHADIVYLTTKNGKYMPATMELKSHYADCPNAKQFRQKLI